MDSHKIIALLKENIHQDMNEAQVNHHKKQLDYHRKKANELLDQFNDDPQNTISKLVDISHKMAYHGNAVNFYSGDKSSNDSEKKDEGTKAAKNWWNKMSHQAQKDYLEHHLRSRKKMEAKRQAEKAVNEQSDSRDDSPRVEPVTRSPAKVYHSNVLENLRDELGIKPVKPKNTHRTGLHMDDELEPPDKADPVFLHKVADHIKNEIDKMSVDEIKKAVEPSLSEKSKEDMEEMVYEAEKQNRNEEKYSDYVPQVPKEAEDIFKGILMSLIEATAVAVVAYYGGVGMVYHAVENFLSTSDSIPEMWTKFREKVGQITSTKFENITDEYYSAVKDTLSPRNEDDLNSQIQKFM